LSNINAGEECSHGDLRLIQQIK